MPLRFCDHSVWASACTASQRRRRGAIKNRFHQAAECRRGWCNAPPIAPVWRGPDCAAAPANRRDLIRRACFDLIGLPPTPAEVAAFEADKSPDAFAHVVDRLLASPQYGERWGRHWLDVARYADSNGLDENIAFANAFRYRDYVVQAFNKDKPYDQFVREQLAGDLLPASTDEERNEHLIATGFLSLGPKVLAEPTSPRWSWTS